VKKILVTGGNGFIGSNIIIAINKNKYKIDVLDLAKQNPKLEQYVNKYYRGDLKNKKFVNKILKKNYDIVIHCAAFIEVGESVKEPIKYYENNFLGTFNLLNSMIDNKCNKIIFSSTAAVYGNPSKCPIKENQILLPINPYGFSKMMVEKLLKDLHKNNKMKYISLRYFNACGSVKNFGERHDPETHLIPLIMQAASGRKKEISLYGNNFKTKDGTCIRDYIHVRDIANAHVKSLDYLIKDGNSHVFNIGSGKGFSVNQVIKFSSKITRKKINVKVTNARKGDPKILTASSVKIKKILNWEPKYSDIKNIIKSAWQWEKQLLKSHKYNKFKK